MIQGVRQLGALVRRRFDQPGPTTNYKEFLMGQVKSVPSPKAKDIKPCLMEININTQEKLIHSASLELDEEKVKKYFWVGNADRMNPQDRFTTDRLEYLISQTIPNLLKSLPPGASLRTILAKCFPYFYSDQGRVSERYRYYLDPAKLNLNITIPRTQSPKQHITAVANAFKEALSIPKEAVLYTLLVNGEILADHPDYHQYLYNSIIDKHFNETRSSAGMKPSKRARPTESHTGTCYLCGSTDRPITFDMAQIKYKWYITQKINFASGVHEEGFARNYQICQDCYKSLLQGERFIDRHLKTKMLETALHVIPEMLRPEELSEEALENLAKRITDQVNGLGRVESIRDMMDYFTRKQGYHQLTLVFAEHPQGNFKVVEVIPEVTPSRIHDVIKKAGEADAWAREFFGEPSFNQAWFNGLEDILLLLPIRRVKRSLQTRPALLIAKHILLGEFVDRLGLLSDFLECARAIIHENKSVYLVEQYSAKAKGDPGTYILQTLIFMKFLTLLGVLQEGPPYAGGRKEMTEIPEPYKKMARELELDPFKESLFLLGTLLARVGSAQWRAGSKDKPVLGKLNYQGMPLSRVREFSVDIFDKLRQYDQLTEDSELIYAAAKLQLGQFEMSWPLSDKENVYYLLSGYAYETLRIISRGGKKSETEEN